ncbi:hypothetical protein [Chryseobacterium binzhouense]|uniref:hypothetical protein n=1 Tax=Chryseobacterium binzhouense TaxID=2593646 RepID=UPI0011815257|nr:hypothetical protein [Chryseobacterium binzhouense]
MSTLFTNQKKIEENFISIFNNKGIIGSVAEKAMNNYQQKKQSRTDAASNQQLHYFCLGHAFKNIDTKEIFKFNSDDKPTRFKNLHKENFNFRIDPNRFFCNTKTEREEDIKNDFLFYLIDAVRNINCHFIHQFDVIRFNKNDNPIKAAIVPFLKESFTLALVLAYQKKEIQKNNEQKNEIPTIEFLIDNLNSIILPFSKEVFYQTLYTKTKVNGKLVERTLNEKQKNIKGYIDLNFEKLDGFIDFLLFNNVEEDIDWELNPSEQNSHQILQIEKGNYLSFNGCLFLLSLFLYKNEANKLIPKISGFKKNGTAEDQAKINVFTVFSKKFSSQDIQHEDQNLVNFRDIIQYLNKYPVAWKPFLEFDENKDKITDKNLIERDYPSEMVNPLKLKIEIQEIQKYFPYVFSYYDVLSEKDVQNRTNYQNLKTAFLQYALNKLFRKSEQKENKLFDHFIEKNIEFQHIYFRVLLNQAEPNNKQYQINKDTFGGNTGKFKNQILNYTTYNFIKTTAFDSWNGRNRTNKYFFKDFNLNEKTDKLKKRIKEKSIYTSNCRNQDRFLLFAIRYLAETNYFGEDAQFKMYQFYDMLEQNSHINTLSKKEKDKLKYDGGKIVYFKTYKEHLNQYPDWEMPFLVENNAVFIKIAGQERVIALQKNIIVYFLEDALKGNTEGAKFLNDFIAFKHTKYNEYKEILLNNETITDGQKTELLKVFPKRLLHLYNEAKQNNLPEFSAFELILKKAEFMEERYNKLKDQADENGTLDFFEKKNKGRQFKLQFIRKACNIMYFKDAYFETTEKEGHHKANNISKDEVNNFSKWMFLFNGKDDDIYKQKLRTLFESKKFFQNAEFQELFNESKDLNDFYKITKELFKQFSLVPKVKSNNQNEVLKNYIENHLESGNIYLNHSIFREFISKNTTNIVIENNKIQYQYVNGNKQFLVEEYYYKNKINYKEPKAHKHLFAKLNANRLEDCLLYEIAFKYLNKENNELKERVDKVLNRDILFTVSKQNENNSAYNLIIPFNKVDRFFELKANGNDNNNILSNLKKYLENIAGKTRYDDKFNKIFDKEIINLSHDFKNSNILKLEDINKVNNHIINSSVRFTKCIMALEEYFIWKHKTVITKNNRIDLTEIVELYDHNNQGKYFNKSIDVKKQVRNIALHFNLPSLDKSYYQSLIDFEKVFVKNEVKSKLNESLDEKGKMPEKVLESFMLGIHDKDTFMKKNFHEAKATRIEKLTEKHKEEFVYKSNKTFYNTQDLEKDKEKQLNSFIVDKYWAKEESKVRKQKSIEEYINIVNKIL